MAGENFEIYCSQMAKNAVNLSTMVGKNRKFTLLKWLRNDIKFFMVGDNFENLFKWLKMQLNCPPCSEKILKFTLLQKIKIDIN